MLWKRLLTTALVTLLSAPAPPATSARARGGAKASTARAAAPVLPPIKYTQFFLPNGLRVIFHEDHSTPIVAVNVWYHVGSKNEVKGYAYGASSQFSFRRGAGPFVATAPAERDATRASVVEFLKKMRGIRGYPRGFETPDQIANQLELIITYDLPDTYFNSYIERVQAVTLEDVNRVANRYLQPDRMAVVIVGDHSKIKQGLRSLDGLGERISFVDNEGRPATQPSGASGGGGTQ